VLKSFQLKELADVVTIVGSEITSQAL